MHQVGGIDVLSSRGNVRHTCTQYEITDLAVVRHPLDVQRTQARSRAIDEAKLGIGVHITAEQRPEARRVLIQRC